MVHKMQCCACNGSVIQAGKWKTQNARKIAIQAVARPSKPFGQILLLLGYFFQCLASASQEFCISSATIQKPHVPYHCIWKIAFSDKFFFLAVLQSLASVSQQFLHIIGHDSKAAPSTAFGTLSVKPFGPILSLFGCFFQCLASVSHSFAFQGHHAKAAHSVPLHLKIVGKAFRTHSSSFWLFLPVFSKCFTAALHSSATIQISVPLL